eukprot:Hpha_TRINITY_DN14815_c0_g2::TRINITY_DN14815_c0_g2_i1::g.169320::m.169320
MQLQLFVRTPHGKLFPIDAPADGTVGDLQRLTALAMGVTAQPQLTFQGDPLDEMTLLADAGLSAQAMVEVCGQRTKPLGWAETCGTLQIQGSKVQKEGEGGLGIARADNGMGLGVHVWSLRVENQSCGGSNNSLGVMLDTEELSRDMGLYPRKGAWVAVDNGENYAASQHQTDMNNAFNVNESEQNVWKTGDIVTFALVREETTSQLYLFINGRAPTVRRPLNCELPADVLLFPAVCASNSNVGAEIIKTDRDGPWEEVVTGDTTFYYPRE